MSIAQDTSSICSQPHHKSVGETPASPPKFHFKDIARLFRECQARRKEDKKFTEPELWPKNRKQRSYEQG